MNPLSKHDADAIQARLSEIVGANSLDIYLPAYNEEEQVASHVEEVLRCIPRTTLGKISIVILNNGSIDRTGTIGRELAQRHNLVRYQEIPVKGRGYALKQGWLSSSADVVCYMDVDLSSSLSCLPALLHPLFQGKADLSVGSRLHPNSDTVRGRRREILSRCYNYLVRYLFASTFSDAQCGFKAMRREAALEVLPFVQNNNWFFDTELLLLCENRLKRVVDVPISWREDKGSTVKLLKTVSEDLIGLLRMKRTIGRKQMHHRSYATSAILHS